MAADHPLLDLLIELQALDRVPRMGYLLRGVSEPESVSEHAFHLTLMVWALAADEPGIDRLRALELALVHDLAEARTGDLPRTAARYLEPGAKAAMERAVASELLAPLGARADELLAEYQATTSAEARFVAACDKMQVRIKALAYARWGAGALDEFWQGFDATDAGAGFATLEDLARALRERRASGRSAADEST